MEIKGIKDEVIGDYKKTAMQVIFPKCDFKCDKENGCNLCQNSSLAQAPAIRMHAQDIVDRYLKNPLTKAFVFGGLEPFDTVADLIDLIFVIREVNECYDDIVIYTGYTEEEILELHPYTYRQIQTFCNIYIKFGRYIPNQEPHFDEVLGVKLASDNQYGKKVSYE